MRYFANASELMQILVSLAAEERLVIIYEQEGRKAAGWAKEKNFCASLSSRFT